MNKKSTGIKLKHSIRTESNRFAWELNQNKVCDDGEWSQICKEDFRWNLKFWNELELRDYSQLEGEERAKGWFDRSASFWRASKWTKLSCSCFFFSYLFAKRAFVCVGEKSKSITGIIKSTLPFSSMIDTYIIFWQQPFLVSFPRFSERCLQSTIPPQTSVYLLRVIVNISSS